MKYALIKVDPEYSDVAFMLLVARGIPAYFRRRSVFCDVICVPSQQVQFARRLIASL